MKISNAIRWLSNPEGSGAKDKFCLGYAKLIYILFRIIMKLFLGKERRDDYFTAKNITFIKYMPYSAIIKYEGFRVRVRKRQDDLTILGQYHEPEIPPLLRQRIKEDDIFVDIGANIGKYVLFASHYIKKGRIIACEPHPETYQVLKENVRINQLNAECIDSAVGDHDGMERLYISERGTGCNSLVFRSKSGKYIDVKLRTLDSIIEELGLTRIDWLLVDTEGSEIKILNGAQKALSITNNIIVEAHTEENFNIVMQVLKANNFEAAKLKEDYTVPHIFGRRRV